VILGWHNKDRMERDALVPSVGTFPNINERSVSGMGMLNIYEVKFQKVMFQKRFYLMIACRSEGGGVHVRVIDRDGIEDLKDFLA
jgi:hypothetical protein